MPAANSVSILLRDMSQIIPSYLCIAFCHLSPRVTFCTLMTTIFRGHLLVDLFITFSVFITRLSALRGQIPHFSSSSPHDPAQGWLWTVLRESGTQPQEPGVHRCTPRPSSRGGNPPGFLCPQCQEAKGTQAQCCLGAHSTLRGSERCSPPPNQKKLCSPECSLGTGASSWTLDTWQRSEGGGLK